MKKKRRDAEMADEVLAGQVRARAERTGESFEEALEAVSETEAGRRLEEVNDRGIVLAVEGHGEHPERPLFFPWGAVVQISEVSGG